MFMKKPVIDMFAVIRIRGTVGARKNIEDALSMLRLNATNNCVLVSETESYKGMIKKVKDFITWGEIDKTVLVKMLEKRLRLLGNKRVDEKILKYSGLSFTVEEVVESLRNILD